MTEFYVYAHTRLHSGEIFYVGKGYGNRAARKWGRNAHWKNIVAHDGGRSIEYLIKGIDEELSLFVEQEAISLFRSRGANLANYTLGGEGLRGYKHTPATLKKMSDSQKGKPGWNKGGTRSAEAIKKMSDARRGKQSKNKGVPLTEELKGKISAARKGCPSWAKGLKNGSTKPVVCVTTGQIFPSALAAAKHYGANDPSSVSACCRGVIKTAYCVVFQYV